MITKLYFILLLLLSFITQTDNQAKLDEPTSSTSFHGVSSANLTCAKLDCGWHVFAVTECKYVSMSISVQHSEWTAAEVLTHSYHCGFIGDSLSESISSIGQYS